MSGQLRTTGDNRFLEKVRLCGVPFDGGGSFTLAGVRVTHVDGIETIDFEDSGELTSERRFPFKPIHKDQFPSRLIVADGRIDPKNNDRQDLEFAIMVFRSGVYATLID